MSNTDQTGQPEPVDKPNTSADNLTEVENHMQNTTTPVNSMSTAAEGQQPEDGEIDEIIDKMVLNRMNGNGLTYNEGKYALEVWADRRADKCQQEEKDRYCGICYRPCIEHGGWKCPDHGYESICISRSEIAELRRANRRRQAVGVDELRDKAEELAYWMYESSGNSKYIRAGRPTLHPDQATAQIMTLITEAYEKGRRDEQAPVSV